MVKRDGEKPDYRFWISVISLALAIFASWANLRESVAENSTNIERTRGIMSGMREDIQQVEATQREILMELRK